MCIPLGCLFGEVPPAHWRKTLTKQGTRAQAPASMVNREEPGDAEKVYVLMTESVCAMHWLTTLSRWEFSSAAATRSLSFSCLFTANSDECDPGLMCTETLNRGGRLRSSFTRIERPIRVAIEQ